MNKKNHLPLTEREQEVFAYILGYIVDNGYSPTRQEIANKFEFTPQGAQKFVQSLVDKGRIVIIKHGKSNIARNIVIVENATLRS